MSQVWLVLRYLSLSPASYSFPFQLGGEKRNNRLGKGGDSPIYWVLAMSLAPQGRPHDHAGKMGLSVPIFLRSKTASEQLCNWP